MEDGASIFRRMVDYEVEAGVYVIVLLSGSNQYVNDNIIFFSCAFSDSH